MMSPEITSESTTSRETVCLGIAVGLHALMLLWNPLLLKSDFQQTHEPVTIDVVDQQPDGSQAPVVEAPKKTSVLDMLKDMLSKPEASEIAHIAPTTPTPQVQPLPKALLQDRSMPHAISNPFAPKAPSEDLAMANAPNQINVTNRALPNIKQAPALSSKAFTGITAHDLPFQVNNEAIAGGATPITIQTGNSPARAAFAPSAPALTNSKSPRVELKQAAFMPSPDLSNINNASQAIPLNSAPAIAPSGPAAAVLTNREGSSNNPLINRSGSTHDAINVDNIPSAAIQLDNTLATDNSDTKTAHKTNKAFDLSGPLNNRPIIKKVIPQYPAWAEEQGIIGSVRLYFTVTPEGTVRPNIRVTKTTGYPQLDQLGIDALKEWQFAPASAADEGKGEWGIITFNFSLSS